MPTIPPPTTTAARSGLMMTPDQLAEAGRLLFGARWVSELARAVGVDGRTVERWRDGGYPIPPKKAGRIRELLQQRIEEIAELLARLSDQTDRRR